MKPIMEERARTQQLSTLVQNAAVSQISDERKPIRTDEAVSELANISRDTIRKIERIEEVAAPTRRADDPAPPPGRVPGFLRVVRWAIREARGAPAGAAGDVVILIDG